MVRVAQGQSCQGASGCSGRYGTAAKGIRIDKPDFTFTCCSGTISDVATKASLSASLSKSNGVAGIRRSAVREKQLVCE